MLIAHARRLCVALMGLLFALLGAQCSKPSVEGQGSEAQEQSEALGLPPLRLTDETRDLLLTWVDDEGNFKVATSRAEVPDAARRQVRVVVGGSEDGTGELVYVADLSERREDGTYAVSVKPRAAWDEVGAQKRSARLEELAPAKVPEAKPEARGPVIIYGASWCKPCHDAEAYLKAKGIPVVVKDIEKDALAQAEMGEKLRRAHLPGASIPIIDVHGRLLVGFSVSALDQALKAGGIAKSL
jgi:glutaredoxin